MPIKDPNFITSAKEALELLQRWLERNWHGVTPRQVSSFHRKATQLCKDMEGKQRLLGASAPLELEDLTLAILINSINSEAAWEHARNNLEKARKEAAQQLGISLDQGPKSTGKPSGLKGRPATPPAPIRISFEKFYDAIPDTLPALALAITNLENPDALFVLHVLSKLKKEAESEAAKAETSAETESDEDNIDNILREIQEIMGSSELSGNSPPLSSAKGRLKSYFEKMNRPQIQAVLDAFVPSETIRTWTTEKRDHPAFSPERS